MHPIRSDLFKPFIQPMSTEAATVKRVPPERKWKAVSIFNQQHYKHRIVKPLYAPIQLYGQVKSNNEIMSPLSLNSDSDSESIGIISKLVQYQQNFKSLLISKYCKNMKVLDVGAGDERDMALYKNAKTYQLNCIEPNGSKCRKIEKRAQELEWTDRVNVFNLKADKFKAPEGWTNTEIDVITAFWSLGAAFKNTEILGAWVKLISEQLKPGGKFLGVARDAAQLVNRARFYRSNTNPLIRPRFNPTELGISPSHKDASTVISKLNAEQATGHALQFTAADNPWDSIEYLVMFHILVELLKEQGIFLITTGVCTPIPFDLSARELEVAKLDKYFVFEKEYKFEIPILTPSSFKSTSSSSSSSCSSPIPIVDAELDDTDFISIK